MFREDIADFIWELIQYSTQFQSKGKIIYYHSYDCMVVS